MTYYVLVTRSHMNQPILLDPDMTHQASDSARIPSNSMLSRQIPQDLESRSEPSYYALTDFEESRLSNRRTSLPILDTTDDFNIESIHSEQSVGDFDGISEFRHDALADAPPLPHTEVASMNLAKKLLKVRLFHEKMKANLGHELEHYESLIAEEDGLRNRIAKRTETVRAMADSAEEILTKCKEADKLYQTQRENLRSLQSLVAQTAKSIAIESERFSENTVKLNRIRNQQPRLEQELNQVTARCAALTAAVNRGTEERNRLEKLLTQLLDSNKDAQNSVNVISRSTQTMCDFKVLNEIETMREEIQLQLDNMKKVQNAISLVRRCT